MKYSTHILLLIITCCYLPLTNAQPMVMHADDYLTKYFNSKQVPSIAAGLMKDGKIIWRGYKGYADIENKVPAQEQTVYRIASISKTFTSAAIIRLASLNRINLDEDVLYYLQDVPKKRWHFTIRQVLNHTSGLRTYFAGEFDSKVHFNSVKDVLGYLANDSLMHEPGTKYLYSSLSYTFLAAIIEHATGMRFTDYMRKFIFEPAGMTQTLYDLHQQIIPNRARGYERPDTRELQNAPLADLSVKFPGGGALSTVDDLLKFGNALVSGVFFPANYLDTMMQLTKLKDGSVQNYGLGLGVWKDAKNTLMIGHAGGGTGFSTQLSIEPVNKIISVHLINTRDGILGNPANELMKIAMGDKADVPKKSLADALYPETIAHGADSAMVLYANYTKDSSSVYDTGINELKLLGRYLSANSNNFEAAKWYSFATDISPLDAQLLLLCAEAYAADNNKGMAIKFYKRYLNEVPGNAQVIQKLKKMETK
ncbi:MAG: serine hydrolase [Ignavibacteriales bacterium]|nr:serine hydrolase [Ignavibacteriales bacterium]